MSYTPKSEEQLIREGLLEPGIYDFEVVETSDKQSKKGNDMYTLKLHIFDAEGSTRVLTDYIALGNNFGERKLRHASDACGILSTYETGQMVPSDFQSKSGKVQLKIDEGNIEYPAPKNVVVDYIKRETQPALTIKETKATGAIIDDEIPF